MRPYYPLYINKEFKNTPHRHSVINPVNGNVIAEAAVADEQAIKQAIQAARDAFDNGPWPKISLRERSEYLMKISQGILDAAQELAKLETLNTGKPIKESTFMDIPSAAATFKHFSENLEKYLKAQELKVDNAQARLVREPQGVVVLIVPWNYPLLIASWKMAAALAAGNTVILKPSSLTPLSVLKLAEIIDKADLPTGVVNIINGRGESLGSALCSDEKIDMISFTGSNEVGRQIINNSSANTKKMIMELGGKSAGIVLDDADIESCVNGSLCSFLLNQGQMCTAMSRIFVQDKIYDKFAGSFLNKIKKLKIGDGMDYQTQMGPLISKEQRESVIDNISKAKKQGVSILYEGSLADEPALKEGFFLAPVIFKDVPKQADIFKEEVFGPVLCINRFTEIEEAIDLANTSPFALASAIWTKNEKKAAMLAENINAGIVWINTYGMFYNELPYGGFKRSGFGKELGREGFLEYTRLKNIIVDRSNDSKPLVSYWYGF